MTAILFLLCWPFASDVADLKSDQWSKLARASVRLERALPWSLPVAFLPTASPDFAKRQQQLRSETFVGRTIDFVWGFGGFAAFVDRQVLDTAGEVYIDLGDDWWYWIHREATFLGDRTAHSVVRKYIRVVEDKK